MSQQPPSQESQQNESRKSQVHRFPWAIVSIVAASLALMAWVWTQQTVSNQELLANYAKAADFLAGASSVGGFAWWSPMFLMGTSLAFAWSFMVTNVLMLAIAVPFGFLAGPKIAAAVCLGAGAWGTYQFVRLYTGDRTAAVVGSFLFLLCPSVLTRAAGFEHFVVICSMAALPWTFFALTSFFRNPSRASAVAAGLAYSVVFLAYGKTGLMALPALAIFSLVELFRTPSGSRPARELFFLAAGTVLVLAVLPNLPALREARMVAMFDFGPFEGWQHSFSTKSPLGWIDRAGWLTEGIDSRYAPTTANGGTYLGLIVAAVLWIALFTGRIHQSEDGRKARLLITLGLLMYWLSFGPRNVIAGQFAFLELAQAAPDTAPALGWLLFCVQVWVIYKLIPQGWPLRQVLTLTVSAIFLIIPGFRLLEWLPIYRNIRAPFDFFQVTGILCLVFASAILLPPMIRSIRVPALRSGLTAVVIALAFLDVSPYAKPFFQSKNDEGVFRDFLASQDFLKNSKIPGRVLVFSGRYFYLLTPSLSGRPLVSEAFNSYLQQRGATLLSGAAFISDDYLKAFLQVAGVSHILIDKTDPDTEEGLGDRFGQLITKAFENENFLILENTNSPGSLFLAQEFLVALDQNAETALASLEGVQHSLITVELDGYEPKAPGVRGQIIAGRIEPPKGETIKRGQPFLPIAPAKAGNYQHIVAAAAPRDGWLVSNQAWHPDWTATVRGGKVPVERAFVGFSAVKVRAGDAVEFRFQQPAWYLPCVLIGLAGWAAALFFLFASALANARKFPRP